MSPNEAEEGADGAADVATMLVALCAVAEPFRVRWDILRLSADSSGPLDPTNATKCQGVECRAVLGSAQKAVVQQKFLLFTFSKAYTQSMA